MSNDRIEVQGEVYYRVRSGDFFLGDIIQGEEVRVPIDLFKSPNDDKIPLYASAGQEIEDVQELKERLEKGSLFTTENYASEWGIKSYLIKRK